MAAEGQGFVFGNTPTILIGLGGSGAEIVARIKALVRERMPGSAGSLPPTFQFLCIDAAKFDQLPRSARVVLDADQEFLFIGGVNPRRYVLDAYHNDTPAARDFRSWLGQPIPPALLDVLPDGQIVDGAKRVRTVGRILLHHHADEVERRVRQAVNDALAAEAALQHGMALQPGRLARAFLVSGTCGGTGSGIFFDVLHILDRILYGNAVLAPQVSALLTLPDFHAEIYRVNRMTTLVPFYEANGWAFFAELKHLLRTPAEFNQFVMDASSRGWQAAVGHGLPEDAHPLHQVFLFDRHIPGVGDHDVRKPSDYYAYVARAAFQLLASIMPGAARPRGVGDADSLVARATNGAAAGLRDLQEVPRIFSAVGYADVRYPTREIATLAGGRFVRALLRSRLLADPDPTDASKAAKGLVTRFNQQVLDPFAATLGRIHSEIWARVQPSDGAFRAPGGRAIDADRLKGQRAQLQSMVSVVRDGVRLLEAEFGRVFSGGLRTAEVTARGILHGEIRSGCGALGVATLRSVLGRVDDDLEARLLTLRQEMASARSEAEAMWNRLDDASDEGLIGRATADGFFSRDGSRTRAFGEFTTAINAAFDAAARALEMQFLAELLLHLCGETEDRPPQWADYDNVDGREFRRVAGRSVLDEVENDDVPRIIGVLEGLAERFSDEELKKSLWSFEGQPVTSTAIPGAASVAALERNADVSAVLAAAETKGRERAILESFLANVRLDELTGKGQETDRLEMALWALAEQEVGKSVMRPVLEVVAEARAEDRIRNLVPAAVPSVKLAQPSGAGDEQDETLMTLAAADTERVLGYLPELKGEGSSVASPDIVSVLKLETGVALRRIESLEKLKWAYFRRDKTENFPHLSVAYQEVGVPGQQHEYGTALWTFLQVRALDRWLGESAGSERQQKLGTLGIPILPAHGFEAGFITFTSSRHEGRVLETTLANRFEPAAGGGWKLARQVELGVRSDRLGWLLSYLSNVDVVGNHRQLLDAGTVDGDQLDSICRGFVTHGLRETLLPNLDAGIQGYAGPARHLLAYRSWVLEMIRLAEERLGNLPQTAGLRDLEV